MYNIKEQQLIHRTYRLRINIGQSSHKIRVLFAG